MQGILKHIIAFICVCFLTHLFVSDFHKEDMVFDPIDTEDNAVIQQGVACLQFYEAEESVEPTKNTCFYPEQRSGKKTRDAKYVSFELLFNQEKISIASGIETSKKFTPCINKNYDYLFYKEINPPPPKQIASLQDAYVI